MENVDPDTCLRLIADERRRRVIQYVRHESGSVTTIDEVADELHLTYGDELDRDEFVIRLHHVHLPKLADAGVLEYESESGAIRYRDDERIERVLNSISDTVAAANS